MSPAARGLYVHVPFCRHFCSYCHFPRLHPNPARMEAYRDLVLAELRARGPWDGAEWDSLFLGGGTPSLMADETLSRWSEAFRRELKWSADAEWTLEANPEDLSSERLRRWRGLGFNRLSVGVQSLDDPVLRSLGRRHGAGQALLAVAQARAGGWEVVSADLLLGLPGQTPRVLSDQIRVLVSAGINHLSLYLLEQGGEVTGAVSEDREEALVALHQEGCGVGRALGLATYETSNMAAPGLACRHNLHYWEGDEYVGLGLSAASFLEGEDRRNPGSWRAWSGALAQGGLPRQHREVWDPEWRRLVSGLRLVKGISASGLERSREGVGALVRDGFLWRAHGRIGVVEEHRLELNGILERLAEGFPVVRRGEG